MLALSSGKLHLPLLLDLPLPLDLLVLHLLLDLLVLPLLLDLPDLLNLLDLPLLFDLPLLLDLRLLLDLPDLLDLPHLYHPCRYSGATCGLALVFVLPSVVHVMSLRRRGLLRWPSVLFHSLLILLGFANLLAQFTM